MFRGLHDGVKKVYLSGDIIGEVDKAPTHQQKIIAAKTYLEDRNIKVMNQATLQTHISDQDYRLIKFNMIDCCDAVIMLNDWEKSKIARIERVYAQRIGKPVHYFNAITAEDAIILLKELRHNNLTEKIGAKDYLALDWAIAQIEVILGHHRPNNKPSCFYKKEGELFCSRRIDEFCDLCDLNEKWSIDDILRNEG